MVSYLYYKVQVQISTVLYKYEAQSPGRAGRCSSGAADWWWPYTTRPLPHYCHTIASMVAPVPDTYWYLSCTMNNRHGRCMQSRSYTRGMTSQPRTQQSPLLSPLPAICLGCQRLHSVVSQIAATLAKFRAGNKFLESVNIISIVSQHFYDDTSELRTYLLNLPSMMFQKPLESILLILSPDETWKLFFFFIYKESKQ